MPANDTLFRLDVAAGSVATALASAGAVYGLQAASFYNGDTAGLAPLTIAAYVGVACAAFGLYRRSRLITGFGLFPAAFVPVGFAWVSSVASLFVGAALFFREILECRKRKR